jgi:hypothetical protein
MAKKVLETKRVPEVKKELRAKRAVLTKSGRVKLVPFEYPEPKKLSKAGQGMEAHPKGFCEVLNWKAVLK